MVSTLLGNTYSFKNILKPPALATNFSNCLLQAEIDAQVKALLALKADYKKLTGKEYAPPAAAAPKPNKPTGQANKKEETKQEKKATESKVAAKDAEGAAREVKKVTRYDSCC